MKTVYRSDAEKLFLWLLIGVCITGVAAVVLYANDYDARVNGPVRQDEQRLRAACEHVEAHYAPVCQP